MSCPTNPNTRKILHRCPRIVVVCYSLGNDNVLLFILNRIFREKLNFFLIDFHLQCFPSSFPSLERGRRGRDRLVVGYTIKYAISAYHH